MNLHDFLITPAESARRKGPHDGIVMSSRVRLARNIRSAAFPTWVSPDIQYMPLPEMANVIAFIERNYERVGSEPATGWPLWRLRAP